MVETYPEGGGRGGARGGARNNFHHEVPIIVEEVVSLEEKVFFPIDKFPGYNFMGRLLGPKGSNLKELVQSTKTRISILGKGSSKDRSKEEELSKSEEHAHLKEPQAHRTRTQGTLTLHGTFRRQNPTSGAWGRGRTGRTTSV